MERQTDTSLTHSLTHALTHSLDLPALGVRNPSSKDSGRAICPLANSPTNLRATGWHESSIMDRAGDRGLGATGRRHAIRCVNVENSAKTCTFGIS